MARHLTQEEYIKTSPWALWQ